MKKIILLTIALFCAVVQGAWADKWDGKTYTKPHTKSNIVSGITYENVVVITSAAEMAYVSAHFTEGLSWDSVDEYKPAHFYEANFLLTADIDMGDVSWTPLGNVKESITDYKGWFYGNGHILRIKISDATYNYQGLFARIHKDGHVQDLHLAGNILCEKSRLVGGIAGENDGIIENCWVSADIRSNWKESASLYDAKVGGVTGENSGTVQYCCVTGNVQNNDADVGGIVGCNNSGGIVNHVTFYGTRNTTHSQDNIWVGDSGGRLDHQHSDDLLDDDNLNTYFASFTAYEFYRKAVQYPFSITIEDEGPGAISSVTASRSGKTITLTKKDTPGVSLRDVTVKDAEGNNITVTGNTSDGYTFTMPKRDVNIKVRYIFGGGSGTESEPYLIKSSEHWNQLVDDVAAGTTYNNKFFRLEKDIAVTTMVGTDEDTNHFSGYFDGNGKTLTVNYNTTEDYAAPFRFVECAVIRNLTVAGSITTSYIHAAGLIGLATDNIYSSTKIVNCRSNVTISSTFNGDGYHSGFVAHNKGNILEIEGCIFDGQMLGSQTTHCAGFVGDNYWNRDIRISQSLFAPTKTEMIISMTFANYSSNQEPKLTNCYSIPSYKNNQQVQIYSISADANVTLEKDGGNPKIYNVSGTEFYDIGMKYKGVLYAKKDDMVSLKLTHTGTAPEGKVFSYFDVSAGSLTGNKTKGFVLKMPEGNVTISACYEDPSALWSGKGDGESQETAYIIDSPERWNEFAEKVKTGIGNSKYAIAYYKLGADISVSTMVGTDEIMFGGHFDGNGKTLTLSYGTKAVPFNEEYCAPFRYVDGADIHNVIVDGNIYTASQRAAGLVGNSFGNTIIKDCRVSVILSSSVEGNGSHGGIVANVNAQSDITGCAFNGQLLGPNTTHCGGLAGWTEMELNFTNCLFAPSVLTVKSDESATFARGNYGYNYSFDKRGCCYITSLGDIQKGKLAYADYVSDKPCREYEIAGIKYYLPAEIVTDVTASDILPFSATISWKSTTDEYTYQVRYRKCRTQYFTSFEKLLAKEGWTTIDADGDGYCWKRTYKNETKSGGYSLASASYIEKSGDEESISLTPDNWLVSPRLHLGETLKVWMIGDDYGHANYYKEHFAIYLSPTGKFVEDNGQPVSGLIELLPETETTDVYKEYTADLKKYKGQYGYIAIRHFNCTGQSTLAVDDFGIYDENVGDTWTIVPNGNAEGTTINDLLPGTTYEYEVIYKDKNNNEFYTSTATLTTQGDSFKLVDDADNSSVIDANDGRICNVTLADRTLYKDGKWNTICLPFNVTINGSPLDGAEAHPLNEASISGSTLNLTFGNAVTELKAGTPYIIKWASGNEIEDPVFEGVTIDKTTHDCDFGSGDTRVRFLGTYKSTAFDAEDKSVLLMGDKNKLYYPTKGAGIGACRAYFKIGDDAALARQITSFNFDFGDGETTDLIELKNGKMEERKSFDSWYTLDGRRLQGKPVQRGVYINNGKKFVIK